MISFNRSERSIAISVAAVVVAFTFVLFDPFTVFGMILIYEVAFVVAVADDHLISPADELMVSCPIDIGMEIWSPLVHNDLI